MKKKLAYLVLHCTATPEGRELTKEDVIRMHTSPPPVGRGWKVPGYSKIIHLNGTISNLVEYNDDAWQDVNEITNGVAGINSIARHFCYIGGVGKDGKPKDTRTDAQLASLEAMVKGAIKIWPDIKVAGHNQFAAKACPSFDVPKWLKKIGVTDHNIYKP